MNQKPYEISTEDKAALPRWVATQGKKRQKSIPTDGIRLGILPCVKSFERR